MSKKLKSVTTPAGTSGLAVAPWSASEVYAVAANWAQASAPVYFYGEDGWKPRQYQVADFQHRVADALRLQITEAICASEGIASEDVGDDEVDGILANAVEVSDGNDDESAE